MILSDVSGVGSPCDVADKILQALQKPFNLEKQEVTISGSIGVTIFPEDGDDAKTLLRNADHAMYIAKNKGRNCCWIFDPSQSLKTGNNGEKR